MQIVRIETSEAPQYAERLLKIYKQLWLETMPSSDSGVTKEDIEDYFSDYSDRLVIWRDGILSSSNSALWVLLTGMGEVVGFSIATRERSSYELDFVFVLPGYQGQGYGLALTQKCLEWLGDDQPIHLGVARHNTKAIKLYEKLGFEISSEPRPSKIMASGKHIPWLEMTRK